MGGKAVDIEEKIPWYRAFPLGLQHFLSMFGATVLVPTLMGFEGGQVKKQMVGAQPKQNVLALLA